MAATIPTTEPASIRAGETLTFKRSLADYPAPTWSLHYYLQSLDAAAVRFEATSTSSGQDHLISVAYATTANYADGQYAGMSFVTDGTTRTQIWAGKLTILPSLATDGDARSQNRRTLDNINAVIEGRATSSILKSTVEGTTLERISFDELLKLQQFYVQKVHLEEVAELRAAGKPTGRNIYAQFWNP